ncbi:MAG TPA: TonB-dependent receptor [Pyrinomonadaceae bacterium]|jgi:hypothetical protein
MMKELAEHLQRWTVVLAIALCPIAVTHSVYGQAVTGTLLGTVTDPNNAVVAGATVTATEVGTNIKHTVATNESGNYVFDRLPLGKYSVEVERAGFKKVLKSGVDVSVNSTTRADIQLEPGTVSEQVTVTAIEAPLQTDRADTGRIVERRLVSELPLPFQNFQYLIFTVPGSTRPSRPHSQFFNSQDSLESKVNGNSRLSNNFQIEGVDDNEKTGLLQVLIPPQYAIESVSFSTSNFDAELGRAGGAVSTVTLKSGTNQIHGSAFGFGNNDNLNASEYFTGLKATQRFRQFGGTIGGPIKKNKIFYFGDFQYERAALGAINRHTVPYREWYTGDFRNAPTKIYDPATGNPDGTGRQQISCNGVLNVICPNRISPIATKLLGFLPGPNIAGAAFAQTNFIFNEARVKKTAAFDTKINYQINNKNNLSYRFSYQRPKVFDPGTYGIYGGPTNGGFAGSGTQNTISTAANYTRTFSSSLIFEGRFGVSWYHNVAISQAAGLKTSDEVGIKNVNTDSFSSGLTSINISGFSGPVLGFSNSLPWDRGETTYVASGIVTKTHGNHTFKFGEEFQKNRDFLLQIQDNGGVRGHFDFNGGRTAIPSDSAAQNGPANAFASFLLDLPNSVGRDIKVLDTPGTRHNSFFTFFQDRWQVSKKLTLTLGLRHEYYTPLVGIVSKGGLSNYDPATNTALVAGFGSVSSSTGVTSTWKNFAPRAGFAYRLNDKTVVRAGFGVTIIPFPDNSYAFNFPVKQNNQFNAPNSFVPVTLCGQAQSATCPAVSMATGFPAPIVFTVPDNGIIDGSNAVLKSSGLFAIPFNLREGKLLSWNIAFQRDLWWGFTGEAAYVGNRGHGIVDRLDLNAATALGAGLPGNDNAARPLFQKYGRTASVTTWIPVNTHHYNSLQVKVDRRLKRDLLVTTSYTLSRAINYDDESGNIGTPADFSKSLGLAGFNRTHSFVQTFVWDIPYARNKHGLVKRALDGWQLGGIFSRQSGTPLDITTNGTNLHAPGNTQRANVTGTPTILNNTGPGQLYFNTSVYSTPLATLTGPNGVLYAPFGTLTRNGSGLNGPSWLNFDSSIVKRFKFGERFGGEIRADLVNALNHPNFNNPNTSVTSNTFGQINGVASSSRSIFLGMRLTF